LEEIKQQGTAGANNPRCYLMVLIPQQSDPTLYAMRLACEEKAKSEPSRGYLGASIIGDPCARKIWYMYNGFPREPFKAGTLWNFEDGHRTEDLIAKRLRMVKGIELWTHDDNGKQFGFSMFKGRFAGHCDGIIRGLIQAPKRLHLWECKACAVKKFEEFKACKFKYGEKNALENWSITYFVQHQIYMHKFEIDRGYMTVALAGGRDIDSCRTEYRPEIAERYTDRAEAIIEAKSPPPRISEDANFWLCRFCDYQESCHNGLRTVS